jgi:sugar phosphate isomerase/epimerase
MKLGLLTAAFPDLSLDEVAAWAAANGFEALELACWPVEGSERRRYSGVSHVDVAGLDEAGAAAVRATMDRHGLEISALAYYPNNLDPDPAVRAAANAHLRAVVDAAALLGVPTVGTFIGRDQRRSLEESFDDVRAVWPPLVAHARERGVRIAIENCPMLFSADEWPGGRNLAYSPAIWRELFRIIPDDNLGLNLDPSHLIWLMIDPARAVREFPDRIFHVHAKDLEIDRDGLYEHGTFSLGVGWQIPRLPGLGEVRWDRFLSALWAIGYDGVVSVEHEDRRFEGDLDLVKRGFVLAANNLRPLIV